MAGDQKKAIFRAVADFSALQRATKRAKRELDELRRAEARANAESAAGSAASAKANKSETKQINDKQLALFRLNKEQKKAQKAAKAALDATRAAAEATRNATDDVHENQLELFRMGNTSETSSRKISILQRVLGRLGSVLGAASNFVRRTSREIRELGTGSDDSGNRVRRLVRGVQDGFKKMFSSSLSLRKIKLALIFTGISGLLALINPLVAAIGSLVPVVVAAGSVLGSFGVLLATIGPAAIAAAAGIGALVIGFKSVFTTLQSYQKLQKASAKGNADEAKKQAEAARALVRAQQDVKRAREDAARALVDSDRRVADAELSQKRALEGTKDAQENLNKARQQAKKDLEDLRKEVSRASLDESEAQAALTRAREEYLKIITDPRNSDADRQTAAANLARAEADLVDVQEKNKKNAKDLAKAEKKGIENSDLVLDAKKAQVDAANDLRDANIELKRSVEDVSRVQEDSARAIEDASQRVVDAQLAVKYGSSEAADAASAYEDELSKLSPSAQRAVGILIDLSKAFKAVKTSVQETLFSGFVGSLANIGTLIGPIQQNLNAAASAMGKFINLLILKVTSPEWLADISAQAPATEEIISTLGDAMLSLLQALKDLGVSATPVLLKIVHAIADLAKRFEILVAKARESGDLAKLFENAYKKASLFVGILGDILATFGNLTLAADEYTNGLLAGIKKTTQGWQDATKAQRESGSAFKTYLANSRPVLSSLTSLLGDLVKGFAAVASDPENLKRAQALLEQMRTELLPAILKLLDQLTKSGAGEALVSTFTALAELLASLDLSGLKYFFDTITLIASVLKVVVETVPGLGEVLSILSAVALLKFTGVLGLARLLKPLGAAILSLLRFVGLGPLLAQMATYVRVLGLAFVQLSYDVLAASAAFLKQKAIMAGQLIVMGAMRLAAIAVAVATRAWAAAQFLLSSAFLLSPIGLVVLAIIALIAAVVVIVKNFDFFKRAAVAVFDFFKKNWPLLLAIITGPFGLAFLFIFKNFDRIKKVASAVVTSVLGFFGSLGSGLGSVASSIGNFFSGLWNGIRDGALRISLEIVRFFGRLPGQLASALSGVFDILPTAFRAALNLLIDAYNSLDMGINISVPSWVPGIGGNSWGIADLFPDIARFAAGGKVPGSGNKDSQPAMLTPNEFVVRAPVAKQPGVTDFLTRLNKGVGFFNEGGRVPSTPSSAGAGLVNTRVTRNTNSGMHVENLNINNPVGETTEESMQKTHAKLSYVNGWGG